MCMHHVKSPYMAEKAPIHKPIHLPCSQVYPLINHSLGEGTSIFLRSMDWWNLMSIPRYSYGSV